jgi:hypothetical protein
MSPSRHPAPSSPSLPTPNEQRPAQARKAWETPVLEELAVQLSAHAPGHGADGGVADCSHS